MFASKDTLLTRPSGGYNIARSVRIRSSASAYFSRTLTTPTNNKIFTWSGWLKLGKLSDGYAMFSTTGPGAPRSFFTIDSNTLWFLDQPSGTNANLNSVAVLRDPSAWYHIVFAVDTTQATSTNRVKMYINGVQATLTGTYPTQNTNPILNSATAHTIGSYDTNYYDGYLTEINFIDGQALTPSSFGETDSITGVWKPKAYSGTYGTNGFELNFSDNSNNTATTIGKDYSGNGNNWTPNNISVTAGATYDSMTDVPTLTSATAANYCVLNPLEKYSGLTIADGNLKVTASDNTSYGAAGTLAVSSGKWYYEAIFSVASVSNQAMGFVTTNNNVQTTQWAGSTGMFMCGNYVSGTAIHVGVNGSYTQISTTLPSAGSYLVCAVDYDNGKAWFGTTTSSGGAVTWYPASTGGTVGDPAAGTNPTITFSTTYPIRPFVGSYGSGANWIANFGQRPFITTAPSGFNAWNTYNLPASTIKNGAAYMAATLWTGNSTTGRAITGVGFAPDFAWIKNRSVGYSNNLTDTVRGATKLLFSNSTDAEATTPIHGYIGAFTSDGYTLTNGSSTNGYVNDSGSNYVGWNWKAGGTSASNTDGSITSTVSAGATQGFSVVTYTGTGSGSTVGHGLGVAPKMIIVKRLNSAVNWAVYNSNIGNTNFLQLNTTVNSTAQGGNNFWNSTNPTSTVFSVGTITDTNASGGTYVAYCFSEVAGYSAFGSFGGNGTTDNTFIYTGFKPRFVLIKRTDGVSNWFLLDSSRSSYNVSNALLRPNLSDAEVTATSMDFVSNGIKLRDAGFGSGETYIYMAFAENPFKNSLAR